MGEKQQNDKKNNEGEKKSDGGIVTAVLKFDMHCEGCAKKVRKSIKNIQGVEIVKTDCSTNKLVVTGKVDPVKIKEKVEEKMMRKVELVSLEQIKAANEDGNGGGGGGDKKSADKKSEEKKSSEGKSEKKSEKKEKEKRKEPSVGTVQFKTRIHCEGCAHKIKKIVSKCEGVQNVNVDLQKDLITAERTMNTKELLPYLNTKLKRTVELAPTKKDDGAGRDKKSKEVGKSEKPKEDGGKSEKPKESGGEKKEGGGEKKNNASGGNNASSSQDNTTRIEVNKMEYNPYNYDYGYAQIYNPRPQWEGYGHQVVEYWHAPDYSHPPQMFSDENPNACFVM